MIGVVVPSGDFTACGDWTATCHPRLRAIEHLRAPWPASPRSDHVIRSNPQHAIASEGDQTPGHSRDNRPVSAVDQPSLQAATAMHGARTARAESDFFPKRRDADLRLSRRSAPPHRCRDDYGWPEGSRISVPVLSPTRRSRHWRGIAAKFDAASSRCIASTSGRAPLKLRYPMCRQIPSA